jgi:uncharacterized membrane protein
MKAFEFLPVRILAGRPRLFTGALCGLVAAVALPHVMLAGWTRAIVAWDIGVLVFVVLSAVKFLTETHARMAMDAEAQQEGEWTIFGLMIAGVMFSFAAIFVVFADTKDLPPGIKGLHVGLVGATLFLSWLMLQVTFAYRYAHEYYETAPGRTQIDRGLEFPGTDDPDYMDFFYFALVSDVQITSSLLRRLAALHGLLGFLFNTIIIALTVNIAAGLL